MPKMSAIPKAIINCTVAIFWRFLGATSIEITAQSKAATKGMYAMTLNGNTTAIIPNAKNIPVVTFKILFIIDIQ